MSNHSLISNKFKILPFLLTIVIVVLIIYAFMKIGNIYNSYKFAKIVNNPALLNAIITEKHTYKRSSFEVKYGYKNEVFTETLIVDAKTLNSFQKGDSISITICKTDPSLFIATPELKNIESEPK